MGRTEESGKICTKIMYLFIVEPHTLLDVKGKAVRKAEKKPALQELIG